MPGPDDLSAVPHILTWLAANGSVLGVVYKWLTQPLQTKIENVAAEIEELKAKLEKIEERAHDTPQDVRASLAGIPTLGELARRIEDLEDFQREMDRFQREVVTDEEFRSYTQLAYSKIENLQRTLGWIKGRLGGKEE